MGPLILQNWRGWLALCLCLPGLAAAAEFRIDSLRLAPDGSVEIGYPSEVGSYFRLLSGETMDRVSTPVAVTLGGAMRVPESTQASAQRFFLVEKLPVTSVVDTDEDGISDVYELLRPTQLNPLNPTDAVGDPDGNGQTFLQEYLASVAAGGTLTTIAETSPAYGADRVAVTRETIFYFSAPLAENTVLGLNHLSAEFGGRRILSRVELSSDRRKATLFYLEPLPASARIQVTFNAADVADTNGKLLDADGDGTPGGVGLLIFDTLSITPVPGTAVIGHVFASELVPHPTDPTLSTNRPLAGVTVTVDGAEQTLRTTTDVNGFFRLEPAPAGRFFATVDGRTAAGSQWPDGSYYPVVGKAWEAAAGRTNNLAAGTGEIYLPLIKAGSLQPVSPTVDTTITFAPEVLQANPGLAGVQITVPAGSLFSDNGTRGGRVGMAPVAPDRLPEPLPPGLRLPLVITIQTDGPSNFDRPVPVRFPNLPDPITGRRLPPGAKTALWSFNHDTGRWELQGSMTITADGLFAVSDPGIGIRQPGWHGTSPGTAGSGGPAGSSSPGDNDGDGIPNGSDPDVDGDGIPNGADPDVDGDGIPNGSDPDVDDDGVPNGADPDVDGDGIPNGSDPDIDGDGVPNGSDPDADGDGVPNESDPEPEGNDCPEGDPCDDGDPCTTNDRCQNGVCRGDPIAGGPDCGPNASAPYDQSDWPVSNNDADAGGNYTSHLGFGIRGGVCFDSASRNWTYRVERLDWRGKINTSTNSGFLSTAPVPADGGNVFETNYCGIISEMAGYLGRGRGVWHTRAASLAHEVHHRDVDWPGILTPLWTAAEAAIEAETAPCDRTATEALAMVQPKVDQLRANLETEFSAAATTYNAGHDSARNDDAYQAGQTVLNGVIQQVRVYAISKAWPACPAPPVGPAKDGPSPTRLVGLSVDPPRNVLPMGQTLQLQVTGTQADGVVVDLSSPASRTTYDSKAPGVVRVSAAGLVSAVGPGVTTVMVRHSPGVDQLPLLAAATFTVLSPEDLDNDGMPATWELIYQFNPNDPRDAAQDADADGLSNLREYELGTNPRNPDTDGDGRRDNDEILSGTNPRSSAAEVFVPSSGVLHFLLMNLETGRLEQRGTLERGGAGHDSLIMAPNTRYRQWVFHDVSGEIGTSDWRTPDSGRTFLLPAVQLRPDTSADSDGDLLRDLAEFVLGTEPNNPDTDGDGVRDGAEVEAGTNPLDGLAVATGIVASADTSGLAQDVAAFNDLVLVADGSAGVTLFNVAAGLNPVRLLEVNTPGEARRVAWSGDLVAVADGAAGLTILDVSNPAGAQVVRQVQFGDNVISVTTAGPIAFVGLQQRGIAIVDMASGVILDQKSTGSPAHDLGLGGDYLFAALASELRSYRVTAGELELVGQAPLSAFAEGITGSRRLFVGATHALVTSYPGYDAIDIRNPAALVRVGTARDGGPNSFKQIVENGSGLGVAAVGVNPRNDGTHDVYLYRTTDPTITSAFLAALPTPGVTRALTLNNGLAYVADSDNGLEVLNYLAYDNQGVAPTIALTTSFPLTGPTNGVAEEGQIVRLTALVTDDVQVRNVEFYVNGVRRFTDGNFPFEVRFLAPVRSATVTSFVVQARAIDTGGNSAVTPEITVTLVPDATPPRVRRAIPAPGALIGQVTALQAFFSEPIDLGTLSAASVRLVNLGADRLPGTSDDTPVTGYGLEFDAGVNLLFIRLPGGLGAGSYQLTLSAPLADSAGNVMTAPFVSTFRVFDFQDTDLDGVPDELEAALGLNPFVADTDGDGLIDGLEDFDNDGLPNAGEVLLNRDPTVADSDGDGIKDGDEDSDGDFLSDGLEVRLGTNPLAADSDLDGWPDETEITAGSNPLNPDSKPKPFLVAQPDVTLSLPAAVELGGLSANTVAGRPSVTLVLPAAAGAEGLAPNTVAARPQVTLVLPAAAGAEGLAPNTVAARPPLTLVLPAAGGLGGLAPNTVLAQPPLTLTLPTGDQDPGFLLNVTLGRPPLFIQIQNP